MPEKIVQLNEEVIKEQLKEDSVMKIFYLNSTARCTGIYFFKSALIGIWAVGMSTQFYEYLTVNKEKVSILWKLPLVTMIVLGYGFSKIEGPLENNRPLAMFVLIAMLEFMIRIWLRRQYIKLKKKSENSVKMY